jgi:hypothetical protein
LLGRTPNGLELRVHGPSVLLGAALWASYPAARATVDSFLRILTGKASPTFPAATESAAASCQAALDRGPQCGYYPCVLLHESECSLALARD